MKVKLTYQIPVKVKPPSIQSGVDRVSQPKDFYVGMNYGNSAANCLANYMQQVQDWSWANDA